MNMTNPKFDERLDAATSRRLSRLGAMPVETARLRAAMEREMGEPVGPQRRGRVYAMFHSMRAVAASVAVLFVLGVVLLYTATAPVSASPNAMVRLHEDLVSGRTPVTQVDSVEAANRELASQWPESPALPGMPQEHVMACCMKSVENKRVACLLLKGQAAPVTMMVANAADMKSPPKLSTIERDGVTFFTQSSGDVNMVSCVRDGRYVCLIGSLPVDRLVELGSRLRF
jgi:hypothetical protein